MAVGATSSKKRANGAEATEGGSLVEFDGIGFRKKEGGRGGVTRRAYSHPVVLVEGRTPMVTILVPAEVSRVCGLEEGAAVSLAEALMLLRQRDLIHEL